MQALCMFYNLKKPRGLYPIRFNSYTVNRTITFCPKMPNKTMTCRGMIPRRVNKKSAKTWLPGVAYPRETDSPGFDTPASQSRRRYATTGRFCGKIGPMTPRGLMLRGVMFWRILFWLAGVWYPGESCFYTAFLGKMWLCFHFIKKITFTFKLFELLSV